MDTLCPVNSSAPCRPKDVVLWPALLVQFYFVCISGGTFEGSLEGVLACCGHGKAGMSENNLPWHRSPREQMPAAQTLAPAGDGTCGAPETRT